jgi:amino acid transporter
LAQSKKAAGTPQPRGPADAGYGAQAPSEARDEDDTRLAHLGYRPQLNCVLGLFANFSVAFTYLSPMVGIFSLFVLGLGAGGPAYIWLTWIPVAGMLLVAPVFDQLASRYPVADGTFDIAVLPGIHGFHHGLGFLTSTLGAQHASANALGLNFGGSWLGAALIVVLAPVCIFYGFESAGDISEETRNASQRGAAVRARQRAFLLQPGLITLLVMAVVTVAGIIVYFAVPGGREIGAHIVDTDAPGTEAESVASKT